MYIYMVYYVYIYGVLCIYIILYHVYYIYTYILHYIYIHISSDVQWVSCECPGVLNGVQWFSMCALYKSVSNRISSLSKAEFPWPRGRYSLAD
jgi:hypothetical protein